MSIFNMSKEFKVGLVVVVSSVILYFGFQFLKGKDFMSSTNSYYAKYSNVQGLTVSNPVLFKGYAVGRVEAIKYRPDMGDSILVTLEINDDIEIKEGTQALIGSTLLGEISINLKFSGSSIILEDGAFLEGGNDEALLDGIGAAINPIAIKVDTLLGNVNKLLGGGELGRIVVKLESIVTNFDTVSYNLVGASQNVQGIMRRVSGAMSSVQTIMKNLEPMSENLNEVVDSIKAANIAQAIHSLNSSMAEINTLMTKINGGEGTIGKLINDKTMYENLNTAIEDIDFLAADFQANPHRYIHVNIIGKKPKEITMINRVKPKALKVGETHLEMELKLDIPSDLTLTFYDMTEKTITPITFKRSPGSTNTIEFDIPAGVKAGDHAVRVSWNGDKDTDYASVEVK